MPADRSHKHAPMEMSSKRPVGRSRNFVESRTEKARDPRFDSLSGGLKPDLFRKSYGFLAEQQKKELADLRQIALAASKNDSVPEEEKSKLNVALMRLESQEISRRVKTREVEAMRDWKKEEESKRELGKKEFYLKKKDQKNVFLRAKYDELSSDKKQLRKLLEKRRRKTGQKEKKQMPEKRI